MFIAKQVWCTALISLQQTRNMLGMTFCQGLYDVCCVLVVYWLTNAGMGPMAHLQADNSPAASILRGFVRIGAHSGRCDSASAVLLQGMQSSDHSFIASASCTLTGMRPTSLQQAVTASYIPPTSLSMYIACCRRCAFRGHVAFSCMHSIRACFPMSSRCGCTVTHSSDGPIAYLPI